MAQEEESSKQLFYAVVCPSCEIPVLMAKYLQKASPSQYILSLKNCMIICAAGLWYSCLVYKYTRALEFICVFLESVVGGEEDLVKCANKAYDESLRKYHGWIVRGIFNVSHFSSLFFIATPTSYIYIYIAHPFIGNDSVWYKFFKAHNTL